MAIVIKRREVYDYDTKKHVMADVPTCEECRASDTDYHKYKAKKRAYDIHIFHDVLCCGRGERRVGETDRAKLLGELFQRANRVLGNDLQGVQAALAKMAEMKVESVPAEFFESEFYSKGDEDAPFFTEAFLYCLLGKDAGRTVLGYFEEVRRAASMGES